MHWDDPNPSHTRKPELARSYQTVSTALARSYRVWARSNRPTRYNRPQGRSNRPPGITGSRPGYTGSPGTSTVTSFPDTYGLPFVMFFNHTHVL